MPLGFSSPSFAAELLLTPVFKGFFTPSAGGGIEDASSIMLGAGVLELDSEIFSSGDDVGSVTAFGDAGGAADPASDFTVSLAMSLAGKALSSLAGRRSVTTRLFVGFFAFIPGAGDALTLGVVLLSPIVTAMLMRWMQDDGLGVGLDGLGRVMGNKDKAGLRTGGEQKRRVLASGITEVVKCEQRSSLLDVMWMWAMEEERRWEEARKGRMAEGWRLWVPMGRMVSHYYGKW